MIYLLLMVWVLTGVAEAATLYVNNSGSPACDNTTAKASNSAASPWCSIGRAAWGNAVRASANASEAAAAGDTVRITAGTYSTAEVVTSTQTPVYNPTNSGTAGNPITFLAVGTVTLQTTAAASPTIGANTKNYITWSGPFYLDEANNATTADTGVAVIGSCTGCVIEGVTIDGNGISAWDDIHSGIFLQDAISTTIRNNIIHDVYNPGGPLSNGINGTGVISYNSDSTIIEHNEIYNCGSGIFIKGITGGQSQDDARVRYNYIHDASLVGIDIWGSLNAWVYQNVVVNSNIGLLATGSTADHDAAHFFNNTVVNNATSGLQGNGTSFDAVLTDLFQNNIVVNSPNAVFQSAWTPVATDPVDWVRNVYYNITGSFARYDAVGNVNFTTWQGNGQDVDGTNGTDPLFVATGSGAAYYKLQGSSPALTVGRVIHSVGGTNGDTIPAGAYITGNETIGIESTSDVTGMSFSGGVRFLGGVKVY